MQLLNQDECSLSWILMEPISESSDLKERAKSAGFELADTVGEKDRTARGKVLEINEDCHYVRPNQTLLYLMYAPAEIIIDGKRLLAIQEKDVIAIL